MSPSAATTSSSRYSTDRTSSYLTRPSSSDYSSYGSTRPSVTEHRISPRTASDSYSRRATSTSDSITPRLSSDSYSRRTPSAGSYASSVASSSRPKSYERSDSSGSSSRYGTDHRRTGTESGYGSLEKDKNKRTGKHTTSSTSRAFTGDTDNIDSIRDKYLPGGRTKTTNGDLESSRTVHTPTTRTHGTMAAATSSSRLTHQNSLPSGSDTEDVESRAARMARYKDQRRKELAQKYGLGTSMIPSAAENDYASRRYRYNTRQSSLRSEDGDESDRSIRSADERSDRSYRKYTSGVAARPSAGTTASRIGSERDTTSTTTRGRTSPSSSQELSTRSRSHTEPPNPVTTLKGERTQRANSTTDSR